MNYLGYVVAAYAVFAVGMLWDLIAPRLLLHRHLRAARLRARREQPRNPDPPAARTD